MQSKLVYDIKKLKKPSKTINLIKATAIITAVATNTTNGRRRIGRGSRKR
jgi:hypothetical protein